MSTNSTINVKINDEVHSVYCHWDGYEDGVGRTLLECYNSQELAEQIVKFGDLSFLDATMDCPEGHTYDTPVKGCSVAYLRDRGKDCGEETKILKGNEKLKYFEEYNYFWDGSKWQVLASEDEKYRDIKA